ncbi:MAG: NAD(P)H-hydrate epimerase [Chloroflexota bacterium]|nr:NAD(P)H-hydrate epimerase [Chloroflexota bacterium]
MREVDRLAEVEYWIAPLQLMEVAGLQAARVAREIVGPSLEGRAVCILAGKGNNGGDGLVAARRLLGWGAKAQVITSYEPGEATGLSAAQLVAAVASGVPVERWIGKLPMADLYLDALLGFGSEGAPRGEVAEMIDALERAGAAILAVDLPSGLDAATGAVVGSCVTAADTVTLAAPKTGMLEPGARERVGRLHVADIGIPPSLLRRVGIDPTGLFSDSDLFLL